MLPLPYGQELLIFLPKTRLSSFLAGYEDGSMRTEMNSSSYSELLKDVQLANAS